MPFLTLRAMQQQQRTIPKLQYLIHEYLAQKIEQGQLDEEQILQGVPEQYREVLQKVFEKKVYEKERLGDYGGDTVTRFWSCARRIDNYLGIGDTFYISRDLDRYVHKDAAGNVILSFEDNASNGQIKDGISVIYNKCDRQYPHNPGPSLNITYPGGLQVKFWQDLEYIDVDTGTSKVSIGEAYNLHKAIAHADIESLMWYLKTKRKDKQQSFNLLDQFYTQGINVYGYSERVQQYLSSFRWAESRSYDLVNYVYVGESALHRAIKKNMHVTHEQREYITALLELLIDAGAELSSKDMDDNTPLQLATGNPVILVGLQQALTKKELFDAIRAAKKARIDLILTYMQQQKDKVQALRNITNAEGQTALVCALSSALSAHDPVLFEKYLFIAQLLINNGATLSNPAGKLFIEQYSKEFRSRLVPYLLI